MKKDEVLRVIEEAARNTQVVLYLSKNQLKTLPAEIAKIESSSATYFFFIFLLFIFFYTSAIKFRMYVIKYLIVDTYSRVSISNPYSIDISVDNIVGDYYRFSG